MEPGKGSECAETKSEQRFTKIDAAILRRTVGGEAQENSETMRTQTRAVAMEIDGDGF